MKPKVEEIAILDSDLLSARDVAQLRRDGYYTQWFTKDKIMLAWK